MTPQTAYVVGVDAGGTSTRALAVAEDGSVLGRGRSGGANPNSHAPEVSAARIGEAISAAIRHATGPDERVPNVCVIGMAGTSKLTDPTVAALFEQTWAQLGLARVIVLSDAEVAFASATDAPDGTVLVAGTGSIAGRIRGHRMVSTVGGYGWLLGDEGSAFWLGREAVRRALDELAADGPLGSLTTSVLAEAGVDPTERRKAWRQLITVVNGEPPIRLARFAPLVTATEDGRPIVARAAEALTDMAMAAREPGEATPIVLCGSVLSGSVGALVRQRLSAIPGVGVFASADGVTGASWLAAVAAFGEKAVRPKIDDQLN